MVKDKLGSNALIPVIQGLLQQKTVSTQKDIQIVLKKQGLEVNQVKISRILHKLGAIKVNEDGQDVYRLPLEQMQVSPKDTLKQLVLNITHNEMLIVINTVPGSANLVARMLDLKRDVEILGTVAGDDTIFVAPSKMKYIGKVYQHILQLLLD